MKRFFLILLLLLGFNSAYADEIGKDINQYNILTEADYSVLFYSNKEAFIKQFGKGDEKEGELRTYFLIGNLNLPDIKKEMIANMEKEKLSLQEGKFDIEMLERVDVPLMKAVDNFLDHVKEIQLVDCFIYMYMLDSEIYYSTWSNKYPKAMISNATDIAISRFDNRFWFNNIKNCYDKKDKKIKSLVDNIVDCASDYKQLIFSETEKVLNQLEPYQNWYENLYQLKQNEETIREYSVSGETYRDIPKIMIED